MAIKTFWLVAIVALAFASPVATAQQRPSVFRQKSAALRIQSISFPLIGSNYLDDVKGWIPIGDVIEQLRALGANDVKVTVSAGSYDSPRENLPNTSRILSPPDEKILDFIRQLKAAGLGVTFQPFVNINFDPNENLLDTVHAQPADFTVWMTAHLDAMMRLARLAQAGGADRFVVIGDEVQPLTYARENADAWVDMIRQTRTVFPGAITAELYADGTIFNGGNTHIDLTSRAIIDALDIIGVGWFPEPLTHTADPPLAQLIGAWRASVNGVDTVEFLQNIAAKYGKPLFIADIAFHSFAGDNMRPNDIYNATIPLVADQQEQADEYDSFLTVMSQNQGLWLLGVSFDSWNRFPPNYSQVHRFLDSAYGENIQGKLAETVLREWYTGQRGSTTPTLTAEAVGRQVTLSWSSPSSFPAAYIVEAGSARGMSDVFAVDDLPTARSLTVDMAPGAYHFRVRAKYADGTSAASNDVAVAVDGAAPGVPRGLAASVTESVVTLMWQPADRGGAPSRYEIEVGSAQGMIDVGTFSTPPGSRTFSFQGAERARYVFRVRATNSAGTSPLSSEVQVVVR